MIDTLEAFIGLLLYDIKRKGLYIIKTKLESHLI